MFCTNCGNRHHQNDKFCHYCGTRIERYEEKTLNNDENLSKETFVFTQRPDLDKSIERQISQYVSRYGGNVMRFEDYLKNYNVLNKIRFLCIILPTVISFFLFGVVAILVGMISLFVYVLVCSRIEGNERRKILNHSIPEGQIINVFNYFYKQFETVSEITFIEYNNQMIKFSYKNETNHFI